MPRIFFVDPGKLEELNPIELSLPDPVLIEKVENALGKLPDNLRQLIIQKFRLGLTITEIAALNNLTENEANSALYEAKRQLKADLASFVLSRWGVKSFGLCRICEHPQQKVIEQMLLRKSKSESWGSFNERVRKKIGEGFRQPRIFIAHLNHSKLNQKRTNNESR